ncbi:MAG: hypothetical protein ACI8WB_005142 [Phenylobacterium sp.]|jgi:hypothetical protein
MRGANYTCKLGFLLGVGRVYANLPIHCRGCFYPVDMKKPQLSGFSALSSSQFNDPTKGES